MSLMEVLMSQLNDGGNRSALSQRLGTNDTATQSAIGAALPMLLGALAKNASRPEGAAALNRALEKDHDGSILGNLQGALGNRDNAPGDAILKHVFGNRRPAVEAGIQKASGLQGDQVSGLLASLAPVVLGALGKSKREQGLDDGSLASMLGSERETVNRAVKAQNPQLGGLLSMLDSDGDGNLADEVGRVVGKGLLSRLFGRR